MDDHHRIQSLHSNRRQRDKYRPRRDEYPVKPLLTPYMAPKNPPADFDECLSTLDDALFRRRTHGSFCAEAVCQDTHSHRHQFLSHRRGRWDQPRVGDPMDWASTTLELVLPELHPKCLSGNRRDWGCLLT